MADWKQITARIRRARTSKDPAGQLSGLYEKTQDAMVAFELARHFETAGLNTDAVRRAPGFRSAARLCYRAWRAGNPVPPSPRRQFRFGSSRVRAHHA
jgi:hypothetical protein